MVISDGLLGRGYWDEVKEKQDIYAFSSIGTGALCNIRPSTLKDSAQARQISGNLRSTSWLDGLRGFAALLVSATDISY